MSKKPISPLRQRLIDDMTARRFSEDTKREGESTQSRKGAETQGFARSVWSASSLLALS